MKKITLVVPVAILLLAGCGKHADDSTKGATQVVAKVNDAEITVHQLNFALSKLGKLDQSQLKPASEKVLQQLVDLELLRQQSIESKLDRDPNVLQVLEATKQQVLAQAYLQKIAAKQALPGDDEIAQFYASHPELFSDRNVYLLQEFVVKDAAARVAEIETGISAAKTADEIGKWLKDNGYEFAANAAKKSAEQLPLELAKKLNTLNVGDTLVVNNQGAIALLFVARKDRQAVDMEKAKPAIQQFLVNSGQQTLVKSEIAALHKKAKLEFYGEFKALKPGNAAASPVAAEAGAKVESASPVEGSNGHSKAIEKGLSGL